MAESPLPKNRKIWSMLHRPIDIDWLVYFRVFFGALMFYWCADSLLHAKAIRNFILPQFHFKYAFFEWVDPLPGNWTNYEVVAIAICALLISAGALYRVATILLAVGFTHLFLIERSLYLNHNYLIAMFSFAMCVLPANKTWSVDAWVSRRILKRKNRDLDAEVSHTFAWHLYFVRFLVGMPYFFGGVAKLSYDWLSGHPMKEVIAGKSNHPFFGFIADIPGSYWFFAYGGLLFDLAIVPMLLWRRTRWIGLAMVFGFHLNNHFLFTIGVFPWFMILATLVFFEPGWVRRFMRWNRLATDSDNEARERIHASSHASSLSLTNRILVAGIACYILLQCVLPIRQFIIAGDPSWTERGHLFAWRMLLRGKVPAIAYFVIDPGTGYIEPVDHRNFLSADQARRFGKDPEMIRQLAVEIESKVRERGLPDMQVHCLAYVSLNGRKPALMVDPNADLTAVERQLSFTHVPDWILPLTEPIRDNSWDAPVTEWSKLVDIPHRFTIAKIRETNRRAAEIVNRAITMRQKNQSTSSASSIGNQLP